MEMEAVTTRRNETRDSTLVVLWSVYCSIVVRDCAGGGHSRSGFCFCFVFLCFVGGKEWRWRSGSTKTK